MTRIQACSHLFNSSHELFTVTVIFSRFHHQLTKSLNGEWCTEKEYIIIINKINNNKDKTVF